MALDQPSLNIALESCIYSFRQDQQQPVEPFRTGHAAITEDGHQSRRVQRTKLGPVESDLERFIVSQHCAQRWRTSDPSCFRVIFS